MVVERRVLDGTKNELTQNIKEMEEKYTNLQNEQKVRRENGEKRNKVSKRVELTFYFYLDSFKRFGERKRKKRCFGLKS